MEQPTAKVDLIQDKLLCFAHKIANGEAGGDYLYCLEEDRFYHYKQGLWHGIHELEFLSLISHHLKEITRYSISTRRGIVENFKLIRHIPLSAFNQAPLINFENYMFDPVGVNVFKHAKEFYSNVRIPYNYDMTGECALWLNSLDGIFEGDAEKVLLLQEFFGYCLTRDTRQHKSLLLLGESRSGKSTILNILREMVGSKNCSSVPLKVISNPQYTPMLINKLVNIDSDVSAKASEFEAEFKTITSGEPVSCNQKFVATFEFVPFCKLVMAANIFPRITDHSSAFYKRLILIPCDRVFSEEEQNKNLVNDLRPELPGILNWAIKGLQRLNDMGRFSQRDFMRDAVQELENDNNPSYIFFEEHIEIDMDERVYTEKGEMYEKYKRWTQKTNNYALTLPRFCNVLFKRYHKNTPKNCRLPDNGKRVWKHLKYVEVKGNYEKQEIVNWQDLSSREPTANGSGIHLPERASEIDWSSPDAIS